MKLSPYVSIVVATVILAFNGHALAQAKPKPKPAPAAAPAPPPPAPEAPSLADTLQGQAKADYMSGRLLYDDGDFAGALVKFSSAYEQSKDVRLLWNMASCEKSLRHYAKVLGLVRQYLAEGETTLSVADKAEAQALIGTIEPFTAALDLAVTPSGARITIDDVVVGEAPLGKPVIVDIGVRKITVQKDGFEPVTKELPVGGKPSVSLAIALVEIQHEGKLAVRAQPGQEIFLDGTRKGLGTWSGKIASGGHTLRVSAPEMRTYQTEILIRDDESRTIDVTLEREAKPSKGVPAWVWVSGGALLVAGAAVGGYFLFRPDDKQPDVPVGTLDPGNVQASFPVRFR